MKALRIFLSVVVSIILVILVVGLTMVSSLKTIVQKNMVTEVIKTQIFDSSNNSINKDEINKILEDKEINTIVNEIIEDITGDVNQEKITIDDATIEHAINYAEAHKEELEKITGEKIDLSDVNIEEIKTEINDSLAQTDFNTDQSVKTVIEAYNIFTSKELFYGLLGAIIFQIVLLALLSWSAYKWLLPAGISLIVSGVIGFATFLLSFAVVGMIASETNISINTNSILINSLIELAVGIIAVVVVSIINKKKKENKELES